MKRVKRLCCATILIALSALVLGATNCLAVDTLVSWQGREVQVEFGPIAATEPTELVNALPEKITGHLADIRVMSVGSTTGHVTGARVLPEDRLLLLWNGNRLTSGNSDSRDAEPIYNGSLSALDESLVDSNRLVVSVMIKPFDPPGVYVCPVQLSCRRVGSDARDRSGKTETMTVLITVWVQPWVRMSTAGSSLTLLPETEPLTERLSLSSSPTVVRIASNAAWTLGCVLGAVPCPESTPVSVQIEVGQPTGPCKALVSSWQLAPAAEVTLVTGGPTCVGDRYWCDVPVTLTIEDPTAIPSGPLDLEIRFSARTEPE